MASLTDIVKAYLNGEEYTLQAGESFADVADRHGMTTKDFLGYAGNSGSANSARITEGKPDKAKTGDKIWIPKLYADLASAPGSIDIPADIAKKMQELWERSITIQDKTVLVAPNDGDFNLIHMNQKALEHGGTYSWVVKDGKVDLFRTGAGTAGTFSPNTSRTNNRYIIGDFHTHPYTRFTDGDDYTDSAFSGGDLKVTVARTVFLDMVQSGETIFVSMRTKAQPWDRSNAAKADCQTELEAQQNAQIAAGRKFTSDTFGEACFKAAEKTCTKYKLAFYSGKGTTVNKKN